MLKLVKRALTVLAAVLVGISAYAQMTTASLNGKIVDTQGEPVVGATVIATHAPSGTQYYAVANAEGRYFINGMRAGGPYNVEITCLGYQSVTFTDVTLSLAEPYALNGTLSDDSQMLSEAIVISDAASKFAAEKTGAATNITSNQITSLPTISRSITDVTKLSPYGGSGMSFAGSDGRTSNFTVDGANFNNNFGLSDGLPGGGSPISIDAIEEMQVVISPYDVRQANFIGGGVNAITKSGTNTLKGSAYYYHRNENMRGDVVDGEAVSGAREKDRTTTYGFTLGGPIIKNKLFFFANYEYSAMPTVVNRWRPSEDGAADPDKYISRTSAADMQTVSNFLKNNYGYDTGSWTDFPADENNMKILGRIDWNISDKHKLALRYNYTVNNRWNSTNGSSSDCGQRTTKNRLSEYSMAFANSMYSMKNVVNTWSFDLNSRLTDVLSNQFLATYSILDDVRGTNSEPFPFIDILDGTGTITPYMSVGYELFTWKNAVHNRVLLIKDDVTYFAGSHKITGGASYEYQLADNAYMRNGSGYYRYNSLQDFLTGDTPETVNLTYGYDGNEDPAARVRFAKVALYGQDEWNPTDRLKLTAGLRIESILFNNADVGRNQAIYDVDYNGYHIDTGTWPTPKVQFSPRIGFVWDVMGDKSLKVRGGTGLFTGRLPLVFFTNMPTNSGVVQYQGKITTKYKNGVATPDPALAAFAGKMITDPAALRDKMVSVAGFPTTYDPAKGTLPSSIAAVDPKFKMPQVWKTSVAIDYAFPTSFPLSISTEVIFNKTVNAVCIRDYNMKPVEGFARLNGADNRHMYPTDYTYTYNYAKSNTGTSAYLLTNTNKGYGGSASVQIDARPADGLFLTAAYTHTVSKELTGMPGSDASSAFTYVPTSEGPNNAPLHNSQYVTPDRFFANLAYDDASNNHFSLYYETWRGGANYTYMYANDLNNDNYNYDVMYIPRDDSEIRFASTADAKAYWDYAAQNPYLTKHAGSYAEAYSVYSPWVHRLDFSYKHDFKVRVAGVTNTLQLSLDVKNLLNLFNSSWGVAKYMNPSLNSGRILNVDRIDSDGVPVFSTIKDSKGRQILSATVPTWTYSHGIGQCWYAQIGLKYMFN